MKRPRCSTRHLLIEIRATDEQCATWWPDARRRCPWAMYDLQHAWCRLFGLALTENEDGFLLRRKECLEAETDKETTWWA